MAVEKSTRTKGGFGAVILAVLVGTAANVETLASPPSGFYVGFGVPKTASFATCDPTYNIPNASPTGVAVPPSLRAMSRYMTSQCDGISLFHFILQHNFNGRRIGSSDLFIQRVVIDYQVKACTSNRWVKSQQDFLEAFRISAGGIPKSDHQISMVCCHTEVRESDSKPIS